MSYRFHKKVKKFVSRKTSIERLNISEKQFNRLTVLLSIYPVVADQSHCYDKRDDWYYRIDDIKRIFFSEAYETLKKNFKNDKKRNKLLKFEQIERAAKVIDAEYNLVDLVKQKYDGLGHSLDDLGNSLRNLYLIQMLQIDNVEKELNEFEEFVCNRKLLNKAFLSKNGVYYGFDVEKIIVSWMVPYPGTTLKDLVEEKTEAASPIPDVDLDFLDFGSFDEEEEETEVLPVDPNDPNKFDISLLKYASPLLKTHLNLILFKLNKLYPLTSAKKNNLFNGKRFFVGIKSIPEQIEFVLRNTAAVVTSLEDADVIITESVDTIIKDKVYIQPQYIFDCLNTDKELSYDDYTVGKTLPPHISPFPSVLDTIDPRSLKLLSNKKKYSILDRVESLN